MNVRPADEAAISCLIVTRRLGIGGTEKHITQILPELRRSGIDASLFVLERGGKLEAKLSSSGVKISGPRPGFAQRLRGAWHLYHYLRKNRPDIVHFFLPEPYLVGSITAALAGSDVRIMSRRSLANYQTRHPFLATLERWLHRRTRVLLGNSHAVVEELARECGDRTKIGLIYNGIEKPAPVTPEGRARSRQEIGLAEDAFVLTIVANLIGYKGHDDLLQALAIVRDQLPREWRLLVVGRDDGRRPALEKQAASLGLAEHILWCGEHEQI